MKTAEREVLKQLRILHDEYERGAISTQTANYETMILRIGAERLGIPRERFKELARRATTERRGQR